MFMNNLVEVMDFQSRTNHSCDICKEFDSVESRAITWCTDCDVHLCETCDKSHRRMRTTRDHRAISVKEIQSSDLMNLCAKQADFCHDHKQELLTFYCNKCDVFICKECRLHQHITHDCIEIGEASQKHGNEIDEIHIAICKRKRKYENDTLKLEGCKLSLMYKKESIAKEIQTQTDFLAQSIHKYQQKLLQSLSDKHDELVTFIDSQLNDRSKHITSLDQATDFIDRVLMYARQTDMNRIKTMLERRLSLKSEINLNTSFDLSYTIPKLESKQIRVLFGSLTTSDTQNMARSSDNRTKNRSKVNKGKDKKAIKTDPEMLITLKYVGTTRSMESIPEEMSDVSDSGSGISSTETERAPFRHNGLHDSTNQIDSYTLLLRAEVIGCFECSFARPVNCAVNSVGQIFIVEMQVSDDHVVNEARVNIYNETGTLMSTLIPPRDWLPWDVVINSNDDVMISDMKSRSVMLFTSEGQFSRYLIKGFRNPRGIALRDDSDLIITDYGNRCLYVYDMEGSRKYPPTRSVNRVNIHKMNMPFRVTYNKSSQSIIVSDNADHCLKFFDRNCNYIFQYGPGNSISGDVQWPRGMCSDVAGHVIVADYNNDNIEMLTSHGRFKGILIGKEDGIENPITLTINPQNHLIIGQADSRVKIVRYLQEQSSC